MNSSREDYLITIYRLTNENSYVNSVTLSKALGISRASVSEMVKKLTNEKLISFIENKIELTEEGMDKAKSLISSHRLWEIFLIDYLHMSFEEAHDQAHRLEHVTGETLMLALNKFLGYPTHCPSGNKIWKNIPGEVSSEEKNN